MLNVFQYLTSFFIRVISAGPRLICMKNLPEEVENFRDKKWRREETLKIETALQVEAMVEDLGFCLGLTDARTNLPSVYIAVCGRRDAYSPKNVQKDYEMSLAWTLKDNNDARKSLLLKALQRSFDFCRAAFDSIFYAIWAFPESEEKICQAAQPNFGVLRKNGKWERRSAQETEFQPRPID